jgi:hypothetical protein
MNKALRKQMVKYFLGTEARGTLNSAFALFLRGFSVCFDMKKKSIRAVDAWVRSIYLGFRPRRAPDNLNGIAACALRSDEVCVHSVPGSRAPPAGEVPISLILLELN